MIFSTESVAVTFNHSYAIGKAKRRVNFEVVSGCEKRAISENFYEPSQAHVLTENLLAIYCRRY